MAIPEPGIMPRKEEGRKGKANIGMTLALQQELSPRS